MFQDFVLDHIALSDRHLQEAAVRIARQSELVDRLEGEDKTRAEAVLATFVEIVEQMHVHRRLLDKELELGGPAGPGDGGKKGPAS